MRILPLNLNHFDKLVRDDVNKIYEHELIKKAIESHSLAISTPDGHGVSFRTSKHDLSGGQFHVKINSSWLKLGSKGFCKKIHQIQHPEAKKTLISLCHALGLDYMATQLQRSIQQRNKVTYAETHRLALSDHNKLPYIKASDLSTPHPPTPEQEPVSSFQSSELTNDDLIDHQSIYHHLFLSDTTQWLLPFTEEESQNLSYSMNIKDHRCFFLRIGKIIIKTSLLVLNPDYISDTLVNNLRLLNQLQSSISVVCAVGRPGRLPDMQTDLYPIVVENFSSDNVTRVSTFQDLTFPVMKTICEVCLMVSYCGLVISDLTLHDFVLTENGDVVLDIKSLLQRHAISTNDSKIGSVQDTYISIYKSMLKVAGFCSSKSVYFTEDNPTELSKQLMTSWKTLNSISS